MFHSSSDPHRESVVATAPLANRHRAEDRPQALLQSDPTSLALDGGVAALRLCADRRHWWIVADGDVVCPGSMKSLRNTEGFRVRAAVGSAFVQVCREGRWQDVLRLPNRQLDHFRDICRQMDRLRRGESVSLPHPSHAAAAPTATVRPASTVRKIWNLMRPFKWSAAVMALLAVVTVCIEMLPPVLQGKMVDEVLLPADGTTSGQSLLAYLALIVLALATVRLVTTGLGVLNGWLSSRIGTAITADLRNRMVAKLHALGVGYHDRQQVGMLMSRVSYDTETFHTLTHQLTNGFLLQALQLVAIGVMLFSYNAELAMYTLLPAPLVIAGSWYFSKFIYPRHHRYWDAVGRQAAALNGMLAGIRVVKAFSQEKREEGRFRESSEKLRQSRMTVDLSNATFSAVMGFVFGLGGLLVWYVGGRDVIGGEMRLGELVAFLAFLGMFYAPMTQLSEITGWASNFVAACHRIFEVLDTEGEAERQVDAVKLEHCRGAIRFDNVDFAYDSRQLALSDINLAIHPGEFIGVVGRSGSGKSTLVNLACRFYDPTGGRVLIDGIDLRKVAGHDLRRHIGMVLQNPFLFAGPVRDNIVYGSPEAGPEQILAAAKQASAHDFVLRLPFGYDTVLGEEGSGLSGGEKQRVSIARALLYDPGVLILDEATSSVDTESERAIQEALDRFSRGRTTIAIAHRLSTLRRADRLLVFDQGKLIEQGTHDELVAAGGLYSRLTHAQSVAPSSTVDAGTVPCVDDVMSGHAAAAQFVGAGSATALLDEEPPGDDGDAPADDEPVVWLDPECDTIEDADGVLTVRRAGGDEYDGVYAVRAFPATCPERYLCLRYRDAQDREQEAGVIRDPAEWPGHVRDLLDASLRRQYLLQEVRKLHGIRPDGTHLRCDATTDAGRTSFLVPCDRGALKRHGAAGRLLVDLHDDHYLIPDFAALPASQQRMLRLHFVDPE